MVMRLLKRVWHFLWYDESILSWLANLVLAFLLVKFVIYPGIGFLLGTDFPIVAVVSSSMEHNGIELENWYHGSRWYIDNGITVEQFSKFPFRNGFNKGDIMILKGGEPKDIKVGEVVVYESYRHSNPIIHRVVKINVGSDEGDEGQEGQERYNFVTKGDNNGDVDSGVVVEDQIKRTGKAIFRIPLLGWIKIWFVNLVGSGK